MLYQIVTLLLDLACGLFTGLCLLRLYMQHQRIPMSARSGNPIGPFLFALTDWLVLRLRRVLPQAGRWDSASLVAAWLAQLLLVVLEWLWQGAGAPWLSLPLLGLFGVLRMAVSALTGVVIVYAVLSWVPSRSQIADLVERLATPPLAPIRRVLPLVGGVDLSPLVLLVLMQIAAIVLATLQSQVLASLY